MKTKLLFAFLLVVIVHLTILTTIYAQPDLTVLDNYPNSTSGNTCSTDGNPNSAASKKASNRLKNRFIIPNPNEVEAVSLESLKAQPFFNSNGNIFTVNQQKEMKPVSVIGYVVAVTFGGRGESCNCKATDRPLLDAHIDLVLYPNEEMADTLRRDFVVVEVTERSRRLAKDGFAISNIGNNWATPILKDQIKGRWVKFTGYMFYDTDHHDESWNFDPTNTIGRNNWRATSWEVHPVTGIEVLPGRPANILPHKPNFNPDNNFILAPATREIFRRRIERNRIRSRNRIR